MNSKDQNQKERELGLLPGQQLKEVGNLINPKFPRSTDYMLDLVFGMLMGDSHILCQKNGERILSVTHRRTKFSLIRYQFFCLKPVIAQDQLTESFSKQDLELYKRPELNNLNFWECSQHDKFVGSYSFKTIPFRQLNVLYHDFYQDPLNWPKKRLSKTLSKRYTKGSILEKMTARGLAIWFLGVGSIQNHVKDPIVYFHCKSFNESDCKFICADLNTKFGFESSYDLVNKLDISKRYTNDKFAIFLPGSDYKLFHRIIYPKLAKQFHSKLVPVDNNKIDPNYKKDFYNLNHDNYMARPK